MPAHRPGNTFTTRATKATVHGAPAIELGFPGVAHKSTQAAPAYPNAANALAATRIAVGEEFVIVHQGMGEFEDSFLPAGVEVGDPLYITEADNRLVDASVGLDTGRLRTGFQKYGRVQELDSFAGRVGVNFDRSTF